MRRGRIRGLEVVSLYSQVFYISPYLSILVSIFIFHLRTEMSPIYGKRLIVSLIDQCAADEPEKLYASVPRNEEDLSQGFKDITYAQLANAINHASWWLDSALGKSNGSFEPFAYVGPKDLMYSILAVAAAKVGRRVRWLNKGLIICWAISLAGREANSFDGERT